MHFPERSHALKSKSKGGPGPPGYTLGPGPGPVRPWAIEVCCFVTHLGQSRLKLNATGALVRTLLVPRGRKVFSVQGYTKFAKCHSGVVYVVRGLVTLRLLCQYRQDIEEEVYIYIYI